MFYTDETAQVNFPPVLLNGDSEKFWSYVKMNLALPWLLVGYRQEFADGSASYRTIFLTNIEQVQELGGSKEVTLIEMHLVTPSRMNSKNEWQMERVVDIWQGTHPTQDYEVEVFITASGKRYSLDESVDDETLLRDSVSIG